MFDDLIIIIIIKLLLLLLLLSICYYIVSMSLPISWEVTCDQALFSFRSVKHSAGKGEMKSERPT